LTWRTFSHKQASYKRYFSKLHRQWNERQATTLFQRWYHLYLERKQEREKVRLLEMEEEVATHRDTIELLRQEKSYVLSELHSRDANMSSISTKLGEIDEAKYRQQELEREVELLRHEVQRKAEESQTLSRYVLRFCLGGGAVHVSFVCGVNVTWGRVGGRGLVTLLFIIIMALFVAPLISFSQLPHIIESQATPENADDNLRQG